MRVLIDIRPCAHSYAGIPHDTRQIVKILAGLREIELSAHIFCGTISSFLYNHKSALKDGKIAAESAFIANLENRKFSNREKFLFGVKAMKQLCTGKFCRNKLFSVSSIFHDYLWRVFFAQTLSIGDIDFSRMAFWGSEINHAVAQYLNTIYTGICTLDTDNFDLYLGQAPFPLHISQKTKLALRWHDSIPITHPDTIHNKVQHNKYFIQNFNLNKGKAFFICNSEHTKNILLEIEPNIKNRAIVSYCAVDIEQQLYTDIKLHKNIIQYYSTEIKYNGEKYYIPDKVFDPDIPYLLAVGTIEPRKNYITLLSAWEEYNIEQKENIQLIIVGNIGWGLNKVLHDITHYLKNAHGLFILQNVPTYNLKRIYSHAIATVVPSIEEGFSYSGVESMAAGTIVLASDISVHREIYNDNALFFNPYSIEDLKNLINKVVSIKNTNDYNKIILKAKQYCTKYSFAASSQRWAKILQTISQW